MRRRNASSSLIHSKISAEISLLHIIHTSRLLGHVSLDTTNHYAQANLETKRKALERVAAPAPSGRLPSWKRDASVIAWLDTL